MWEGVQIVTDNDSCLVVRYLTVMADIEPMLPSTGQ